MEALLLLPFAAGLLLWRMHMGEDALIHGGAHQDLLLISSGIVTSIPLVMFAYGAQRLRLATLGLLQYLSPTVQFLLGLLVYHELFDSARLQACVLIGCGLVLYTVDSFVAQRRGVPLTSSAAAALPE